MLGNALCQLFVNALFGQFSYLSLCLGRVFRNICREKVLFRTNLYNAKNFFIQK